MDRFGDDVHGPHLCDYRWDCFDNEVRIKGL